MPLARDRCFPGNVLGSTPVRGSVRFEARAVSPGSAPTRPILRARKVCTEAEQDEQGGITQLTMADCRYHLKSMCELSLMVQARKRHGGLKSMDAGQRHFARAEPDGSVRKLPCE